MAHKNARTRLLLSKFRKLGYIRLIVHGRDKGYMCNLCDTEYPVAQISRHIRDYHGELKEQLEGEDILCNLN